MKTHLPASDQEQRWLLQEKYHGIETADYHADVQLLHQGMPVGYLIGHREFIGCHIDLSFRPLIPRDETEYWCKNLIDTQETSRPIQILDICAGSGCIGIACLVHLPCATVDFVEYNSDFVNQITRNLQANNIDTKRCRVYQSDMFADLPPHKYDYILANPPYICPQRVDTVQQSVHTHEDHNSLYAPDNGLSYIKTIIDALDDYLAPDGVCYIEYDPWQSNLIIEYMASQHPDVSYCLVPDQYQHNRVLVINK